MSQLEDLESVILTYQSAETAPYSSNTEEIIASIELYLSNLIKSDKVSNG